jgi:hypothetical protein
MQGKCPACNAVFSLDVAFAIDAGREAVLAALKMPAPLALLFAKYLGMFRASGRALSFDRMERLMSELVPMFEKSVVTRNGLSRPCALAFWQQGIEKMIELRETDKLQLPLKTHGYLLEIVFGLADQAGAKQEKVQETQRRSGARSTDNDKAMERTLIITGVRGDLDLKLCTRAQAEQKLRDAGISPEVLNG